MILRQRPDSGFTIVEVILTVTLIGLLVTPIIGGSFYFYAEAATSNRRATMDLESQVALRGITDDLRMAAGLDSNNNVSDASRVGGWTAGGSEHVLIIAVPAQDKQRNFIIDSSTSKPYRNEIVYYSSGRNFYRRTLPNPSAPSNGMTRSCPPASETAACPADTILSTKYDMSSYTLYDGTGAQTIITSSARSVKIALSVKDSIHGRSLTATNTIWVRFRNS